MRLTGLSNPITNLLLYSRIFEILNVGVGVCFVLCKYVSGLILWFIDNLWFDDLRAE